MGFQDDIGVTPLTSHNWFPDIGATNHATPNISEISTSYEYTSSDTLCVGNGTCLPISRVSHASFATSSRSFRMFDVLHIPGLSASLLSVQRFAFDNNVFFFF